MVDDWQWWQWFLRHVLSTSWAPAHVMFCMRRQNKTHCFSSCNTVTCTKDSTVEPLRKWATCKAQQKRVQFGEALQCSCQPQTCTQQLQNRPAVNSFSLKCAAIMHCASNAQHMRTMQQTGVAFRTDECHATAILFPLSLNSGDSKSATDLQLKPQSDERLYISASTSAHQHYCQLWHSSFGRYCMR